MKIVIVIPFYNEVNRIDVESYHKIFAEFSTYHFLLVNDGSSDTTLQFLEGFKEKFSNVNVLNFTVNVGKAAAIRNGVLSISEADFICYYDADLATPMTELEKLIQFSITNSTYKFVMGARIKLIGNGVKRSLKRHYFGRIFATIVSQFILKVPIYDTQCGAKVIQYQIAKQIFDAPFISKWLFDVEVLKRLQQFYDLKEVVKEIPLENWEEIGNSKIKFGDFLRIPFQLLQIYRKYE